MLQVARLDQWWANTVCKRLPFRLSLGGEFEAPRASETTVLVAGATGRVGRILVRKLLLRGYKVRALVRRRDPPRGSGRRRRRGKGSSGSKEGEEAAGDVEGVRLPQSVQLVFGDLADYRACRRAVEGADKVCLNALCIPASGAGGHVAGVITKGGCSWVVKGKW